MRILIVDNSNTRTKFALASGDELLDWHAIVPTPEISPDSLRVALKANAPIQEMKKQPPDHISTDEIPAQTTKLPLD